jgi:hypothetical protein
MMQFDGKLATEIHRIALDLLCIRVIFKSKVVRGNRMAQKEKTETETEAVYLSPSKTSFRHAILQTTAKSLGTGAIYPLYMLVCT